MPAERGLCGTKGAITDSCAEKLSRTDKASTIFSHVRTCMRLVAPAKTVPAELPGAFAERSHYSQSKPDASRCARLPHSLTGEQAGIRLRMQVALKLPLFQNEAGCAPSVPAAGRQ